MNDDEAVREVAWVAREAREISGLRAYDDAERLATFFERKAALLRHIGDEMLAEHAVDQAKTYRLRAKHHEKTQAR